MNISYLQKQFSWPSRSVLSDVSSGIVRPVKLAPRSLGYAYQREHNGHFCQHAHCGCQCRTALQAKQTDGYGHGQLKEIRRSYHAGRCRNIVGQMPSPSPWVGNGKDKVGLNDEGHGDKHDVQRVVQYGLALKRKENDEGEQ